MTETLSPHLNTILTDHCLPIQEAKKIERDCVCSSCWNGLELYQIKGQSGLLRVVCPLCGESASFVSKKHAERRQAESAAQAVEARRNLETALPWVNRFSGKSETDLMKDLGF